MCRKYFARNAYNEHQATPTSRTQDPHWNSRNDESGKSEGRDKVSGIPDLFFR